MSQEGNEQAGGARRRQAVGTLQEDPAGGRGPTRRKRGLLSRVSSFILLLLALAMIGGIVAFVISWESSRDVKPGKPVTVKIPKGADAAMIAEVLHEKGVIRNSTLFRARLRMNGDGAGFKSGTYRMKTVMAYDAIITKLEKGPAPPPVFNLTIPEGMRVSEISSLIDRKQSESTKVGGRPVPPFTGREYNAALKTMKIPASYGAPKSLKTMEGFMFPATYELLNRGSTAQQLANKQLEAFQQNFDGIDLSFAKKKNLTPYEVVIIASMIEREAQLAKERPLVASVIYNRLKARMTLGIDATIQYAVDPNVWKKELTESDLAIDSPYNTRLQVGLPPTPIANPGKSSLEAAAKPAESDYLYYVADPAGSGKHHFHTTYDAFLADPYQQ